MSENNLEIIGKKLRIDWHKISKVEFQKGLKAEQEHRDITGGNLIMTAKIVLAHLKEDPKYYSKMEECGMTGFERKKTAQKAWDVFLHGKKIDTVYFAPEINAFDVIKSLVEHNNYDPDIVIRLMNWKKPPRSMNGYGRESG